MSNLSKAKEALEPKKEYSVLITTTRQYSINLTAKDQTEAEESARDEYENGNAPPLSNETVESIDAELL